MNRWMHAAGAATIAAVLMVTPATAEEKTGWKDTAEFSFVATGGNSDSSSLGFKNTLSRAWDKSQFKLRAGGIRVETTNYSRIALGTVDDFTVDEEKTKTLSAENYFLKGVYDRKISERAFWFAGAGWDRNEPSGIKNRYIAEGGVGNSWIKRDDLTFSTTYGVTFTKQDDVIDSSELDEFEEFYGITAPEDTFFGVRFGYEYMNKLNDSSTFESVLVLDDNLKETSDFRADFTNSIAVSMSARLALKVSLQMLYDNEPAFQRVARDPGDVLLGEPAQVPFELDDLDTILTASLVVNF